MADVRFLLSGDSSVTVEFGNEISPAINAQIRAFTIALEESKLPGIVEVVPTYRSLMVHYDPGVILYDELVKLPETGKATMVGYLLKNTASLHGTVSRGVCQVEDGKLRSIREALKVQLYPDGTLKDLAEEVDLSPETVVSMNFWGFAPSIFPALRDYFENFLRTEAGDNIKAECLLPVMVGDQLKQQALEVSVLRSADKWFGMTYHEDREIVAEELRKLHAKGDYPESLQV